MTDQTVLDLGAQAAFVTMKIAAPALIAILATGILISILQAATQINEQTLSFIPKVLAMTVALFVTGPWIIATMLTFTRNIFDMIPHLIR